MTSEFFVKGTVYEKEAKLQLTIDKKICKCTPHLVVVNCGFC